MPKQLLLDLGIEAANDSDILEGPDPRRDYRSFPAYCDRRIIRKQARNRCAHCGEWAGYGYGHVDHIQAVENGGPDCLSNMQLLCYSCHYFKTLRDNQIRRQNVAKR